MKINSINALVAAIIGSIVSVYLVNSKFSPALLNSLPGMGNNDELQNSQGSTMWGIPIVLFGVLAYLILISFLIFESGNLITKKYVFFSNKNVMLSRILNSLQQTWQDFACFTSNLSKVNIIRNLYNSDFHHNRCSVETLFVSN